MDLGLNGRVAIVGGGSKGLGRACADSLAQEGAKLSICSRNVEELEAAASEIRAATGVEVLAVRAGPFEAGRYSALGAVHRGPFRASGRRRRQLRRSPFGPGDGYH